MDSNGAEPCPSTTENKAIGVTIITGFLGSGKSTLIRRILTEQHGLRLVVVENEFSAKGTVEEAIVTQGVGPDAFEQFIQLPNGCICCAAQDDLTDALSRLIRSRPGQVDHILVEASGLADPGPVAASFWVDDELETGLILDSVVAIADAVNIQSYLRDGDGMSEKARITQKQLVVADQVLLNKIDLLGTDPQNSDPAASEEERMAKRVSAVERSLREAGCSASINPTKRCIFDISKLLGVRAYDYDTSARSFSAPAPEKFSQHVHGEKMAVGTLTVSFEKVAFDSTLLDRAFGELLWENGESEPSHAIAEPPMEIWRMKALVEVEGEQRKWIYQSVHTLFESSVSSVDAADGVSHFIFIGKLLESTALRACLEKAIAVNLAPSPSSWIK
ncbi:unnamed protein product [Chondrus crispus]|uniref:CobW C-terminal domain-containing protein n=1 Tax=Chondrus crispus TaxID=2769 RepID=R7QM27_CHOCR|nr:unnamed protein product [Chondrus crispus]CDF38838.1 unnamed protein product [Chondrus crispus]|eukprot:XP_005718743.1 unnamed protein product [Chondrus crispus]